MKVQLIENLPAWIDPSDVKATKRDEPDDVTVAEEGLAQYEPIADDDVDAPLYSSM